MRHSLLATLLMAVLPLSGQPRNPEPSAVLMISADGVGADQFTPRTMPKLWALAAQGRKGRGLPPFPSTTYNGHATLATGCWPEHHGVVANSYRDPVKGTLVPIAHHIEDLQREPLWAAATRSGIRTAVYHWVGATGPWEGVTPWRMVPFAPGHPDAEALAFSGTALEDGARLVMTYLSGTDEEGHRHGPRSAETLDKLRRMDDLLTPWLAKQMAGHPGLRIILTADHGMAAMQRRIHLPTLLDGLSCTMVPHGGSAYIYLDRPSEGPRALARLRRAGLSAWGRLQVPPRYHLSRNERVGDLVVLAPEGQWLSKARSSREADDEQRGRQGAHAYAPETRAMQTWLLILGTGSGDLGSIPLWDLAPTAAAWLGIRWSQEPDGRPLRVPPPSAPGKSD